MLDLMKKLAWIALLSFLITGCVTPGIKEDEKQDLEKRERTELPYVYKGMSVAEFRHLFPEAYFVGYHNNLTAYLVDHSYDIPYSPQTHYRADIVSEKLRFHFDNGRLMEWDLPSNSDKQTDIEFH